MDTVSALFPVRSVVPTTRLKSTSVVAVDGEGYAVMQGETVQSYVTWVLEMIVGTMVIFRTGDWLFKKSPELIATFAFGENLSPDDSCTDTVKSTTPTVVGLLNPVIRIGTVTVEPGPVVAVIEPGVVAGRS
jgi:hypothetical protein